MKWLEPLRYDKEVECRASRLCSGGFLGIGGSGANTDRGNILSGIQSQWNVFGQGLGLSNQENQAGQKFQQQGQGNLDSASQYWNNLLTAGRTQTAQNSAPAVDAAIGGANAQRNASAQFGSGRSGGTAAANATAATGTQSNIDNIINQNLVGGRKDAAEGLTKIGGTELNAGSTAIGQAENALGIAGNAGSNVASIAAGQYDTDYKNEQAAGAAAGQSALQLFSLFA